MCTISFHLSNWDKWQEAGMVEWFSERGVKPADFLVLGVQSVVKASDGHHDDAFSCHILEGSGNGDGATLTDQIRVHAEYCAKAGWEIWELDHIHHWNRKYL